MQGFESEKHLPCNRHPVGIAPALREVAIGAELHDDIRVALCETVVDGVHQVGAVDTPCLVLHLEAVGELLAYLGSHLP